MKRLVMVAALIGAVFLGSMQEAHAYLDPGVGSMLLQGLIAGIAAASVAAGYYWDRLKTFFRVSPKKPDPASKKAPDRAERR